MSKHAILYARVSSDEQTNNYSLPTQLAACRAYAEKHDWKVLEEITDDCSGSIPVAARPGGSRVYEQLRAGRVAVIVMYTIDRTARDNREYPIEFLLFLRDVQDAGAELHFVDTGRSDGGIIDMFRAWQASEERHKIRERSMRGKRGRAQAGLWIGSNVTPYGYRKVGTGREARLEIDPVEGPNVRRIFALYAGETGERYTLRALARQLNEEGVAPPNRHKEGRGWYIYTLKSILNREAYIGRFYFKGILIELPELRLVTDAQWATVQTRLRENRENAKTGQHAYLLSGRIRCSCGAKMSGMYLRRRRGGRYYYYICCTRNEVVTRCDEKLLNADWLEAAVWDWLYGLLHDEERLNRQLDAIEAAQTAQQAPQQQRLASLAAALERARRKSARLAQAYGDADNDTLAEILEAQLKAATQELAELTASHQELSAELQQTVTPEKRARIQEIAANIRLGIEDPDFETKRAVLSALNVRLMLLPCAVDAPHERRVKVTCEMGGEVVDICNDSVVHHYKPEPRPDNIIFSDIIALPPNGSKVVIPGSKN